MDAAAIRLCSVIVSIHLMDISIAFYMGLYVLLIDIVLSYLSAIFTMVKGGADNRSFRQRRVKKRKFDRRK